MTEDERANIMATLKSSLDSLFQEKLGLEEWRKKLANFSARVNFGVKTGPNQVDWLTIIAENGKIDMKDGKIDDQDVELIAPFEVYFKISSRQVNPLLMLLGGKVKAKTSLKNIKKLLMVQNLLIIVKK